MQTYMFSTTFHYANFYNYCRKRGVFYFETGQREKAQEEDENMF